MSRSYWETIDCFAFDKRRMECKVLRFADFKKYYNCGMCGTPACSFYKSKSKHKNDVLGAKASLMDRTMQGEY